MIEKKETDKLREEAVEDVKRAKKEQKKA